MNQDFSNFNEELLNERKDKHCGYRLCPFCGSDLNEKLLDGHSRMVCSSSNCDYIYYQNPVPAAGAIIVQDNKILLVKRAHPPKINYWCIPAGFMEWKEHPSETAVRELKEETGLDVKLTSFFEVYTGNDDPRANAVLMLYLAEITGGKMQASDDALDVDFFDLDNPPNDIAFESHLRAIADYNKRVRGL